MYNLECLYATNYFLFSLEKATIRILQILSKIRKVAGYKVYILFQI
jgi:hypothetical protein